MDKSSKILLIEDEVITAMSLIMDLKKHGYKDSQYVSTGSKAAFSAADSMPDIIIADVSLSDGESGIDIAAEISGSTCIPIIITSGYEVEELSSRMKVLNNAHFLRKPINIHLLIRLLDSL